MTEVRVAVHFWMTVLENSELEERELPPLAVGPVVMGGVVKGLFQHEVKHNSIRWLWRVAQEQVELVIA